MASSLSMGRGPDSDKGPHALPFLSAPIHHFRKTVSFVQDGHGGLFVLCSRKIHSTHLQHGFRETPKLAISQGC